MKSLPCRERYKEVTVAMSNLIIFSKGDLDIFVAFQLKAFMTTS